MNQIVPGEPAGRLASARFATGLDRAGTEALIRRLVVHCNRYRDPDNRRAAAELAITLIPFLALGATLIWLAVAAGPLLGAWRWVLLALLSPFCAAFLVRLFALQHDCGHGSFTTSRTANRLVGQSLSVFTFTPYALWQRAHALHHATSGNLEKRGVGDIDTRTVAEYRAMTGRQRLAYRIYRNPFVLLVIGVPLYFLIVHRLPYVDAIPRVDAIRSAVGLDLALFLFYGGLVFLFGWGVALAVLPVVVIGAWTGGWLFYVQHQFEETQWDDAEAWNLHVAAFGGSSWYVMPKVLQWFSGSIGLHHIHHLCSRIPGYRLQECLDASVEMQMASESVRLTIRDSLSCVKLALWDEDKRRLVSFAEAAV